MAALEAHFPWIQSAEVLFFCTTHAAQGQDSDITQQLALLTLTKSWVDKELGLQFPVSKTQGTINYFLIDKTP